MTTMPKTLTPQVVGQAENAHQPILTRVLAPTGVTKDQWVALTMTATAGGAVEEAQLAAQMAGALKIDRAVARATIAGLVDAGLLLRQASQVGFSEDGRAQHGQIRAAIDAIIVPAYADIPAKDLATAARVLTIITTRLNAA
jgi:DNA-binding MarR family transcriptional regulator